MGTGIGFQFIGGTDIVSLTNEAGRDVSNIARLSNGLSCFAGHSFWLEIRSLFNGYDFLFLVE